MLEIGGNIVKGIWDGITGFAGWLWDKISGFCSGIVDGIKGFFGISSPSKLMKNLIGKNMALGIGIGFEDEMPKVNKQIRNSIDDLTAGGFTADINGTSQMAEAGAMGGKSVVIYQTNNYKSSHSRYEIFKSKQQTEAAVKLALLGV
jgi:phage-related protein